MMTEHAKTELRDRLLAEQASDPKLKLEYERKLNAMFEIQLPVWKKLWFTTVMLVCLIAGLGATVLALTETLPRGARTGLLVGAGFSLAWLIFFARLLKRGTLQRRIDPPLAAGMAFGFSLTMCVIMAAAGLPTDQVILMAVLLVFPAGLMVLRAVVEQSEMRMQEQLVELQYRLARLAEKLDDDGELGAGVRR